MLMTYAQETNYAVNTQCWRQNMATERLVADTGCVAVQQSDSLIFLEISSDANPPASAYNQCQIN